MCKLNKALYGLKQALRACFDKLKATLIDLGFISVVISINLSFNKNSGKIIYIQMYMDDILFTGNDMQLLDTSIQDLNAKFALKIMRDLHYFLSFEVHELIMGYILIGPNMIRTC